MITKETLLEKLESYKSNLYLLKMNKLNKDELIEEICLSSPVMSDVPRSITNKFNSKTENAVLRLDQEIKYGNDAIKQIARDVIDVAWLLDTLTIEQRLIIECKYILEYRKWVDIAKVYQGMMKLDYVSVDTVKKIKNEALQRMLQQYERYSIIAL